MTLKRYLKIYLKLFKANLSLLLTYRANFINNLVASLAWAIFSFVSILLLTSRITTVQGWSQFDLIFLTAVGAIFIGIYHMFFSVNFNRMADLIHYGQLEGLLLKPLDSQFSVSAWNVSFTHISRILMGIVAAGYLLYSNHISISFLQIILFLIILVLAEILLYSAWFIIMTLIIWHSRLNNLVDVLYTVSSVGRYPKEAFQQISNVIFVILIPFIFPINTPANILLNRPFTGEIFIMIFLTIALFIISRKFWHFALRHYTSVSG